MDNRKKAILALVIANVIWGAASPIFKWSLTNIAPFTLALFRFSLAGIILFPFVSKKLNQIKKEDLKQIVLFCLCGVTLNITFFFLGLRMSSAINAAIIATAEPLFLLVLGALFLKEDVQEIEILGTLVSFLGVSIIILYPLFTNGGLGESTFLGNLFLFLAMLGAVGQAFFGKKLFKKYSPTPITFLAFFIGSLTFFPLFLWEYWQNPSWLASLDTAGLVGIIYGAIFSSALAYSLYDWGLSQIEASETGIFTYLMPITAILIAVPFFGEKITWPFVIGSSLVLGGILLTERRLPYLKKSSAYHPLHKHTKN